MSVPRDASRFDPSISSRLPQTPTFLGIIRRMVREGQLQTRVCLPCSVVFVSNSYTVDVQPLLQSQYNASPEPITLPILPNVPVSMPCGQGWSVKYPINVGDKGVLTFCDRSLDAWLASTGEVVDPQDARLHDLTDGIFTPGLLTTTEGQNADDRSGDIAFSNGLGHLRITKTGQVLIGNDQADLAAQVADLAQQVISLATSLATKVAVPGAPLDVTATSVITSAANILASAQTIANK